MGISCKVVIKAFGRHYLKTIKEKENIPGNNASQWKRHQFLEINKYTRIYTV